ncbi:MAG: hypothetical protein ACM3KR_05030 [Deltaproteobacteria bacterium]
MSLKRYRVGIMVIIFLFILDIMLPFILTYVSHHSSYGIKSNEIFENNFRFGEKVDKLVLDAFVYHIKKQDGYKVVFIGDSVIAGAMVKSNSDTIPAFFQALASDKLSGKKIRVYNLAMPGNRPSDIYLTLKKLYASKAANLIIMDINYAFYSNELLKENTIARPDNFFDVMEYDSAVKLGLKASFTENWIKNNILNKWNLYNMREELSFYLFGNNPREELTSFDLINYKTIKEHPLYLPQVDLKNNPDKIWIQNKPFSVSKISHWKNAFDIKEMNESNISWWFLQRTNSIIKENNIRTAAFFTPVNSKLIEEYKLIPNINLYNNNYKIMKDSLNNSDIRCFDYTNSIKSDYFCDLFHMAAAGNKQLALTIFKDVEKIIREDIGQ